jgi:hypothetical protein
VVRVLWANDGEEHLETRGARLDRPGRVRANAGSAVSVHGVLAGRRGRSASITRAPATSQLVLAIDVDHREAGGTLLEDGVRTDGSGLTQLVNAVVLAGLQETPCSLVIGIGVGAPFIGRSWTESLA